MLKLIKWHKEWGLFFAAIKIGYSGGFLDVELLMDESKRL